MAARKKGRRKKSGTRKRASKGRARKKSGTRKKGSRRSKKRGKGQIPLDVLEKRAKKLSRLVISRGGSV